MKRLFYDIETSKAIGTFWRAGWKKTITYKDILFYPKIICICYKWEHEKEVHSLEWDKGNDEEMLREFIPILESADEIVSHNGGKFDQPWIRTQAIFYRIPMSPDLSEFDTLKNAARGRGGKGFNFQSNRLDALCEFFGIPGKMQTNFELWNDITLPAFLPSVFPMSKQYDKQLAYMVKYCKIDVKRLESVFHIFKPYVAMKIHEGVAMGGNRWDCQKCGSGDTYANKETTTPSGMKKIQWYCPKCVPGKRIYSHTTAKTVFYARNRWQTDRDEFNDKL